MLLASLGLPAYPGAETPLPAAVLKRAKDALVFIKLSGASGSGFLIHKDAAAGYVVTNAHVVGHESRSPRIINVVFNSGSSQERVYFATVAAQSDSRDLALLKIEATNLPAPLELAGPFKTNPASSLPIDTHATRPVDSAAKKPIYILGFPYGDLLAAGQASPEATVAEGEISAIRAADGATGDWIEFAGDVNPGNSGGPVIDGKGVVQGVTTLKILGQKLGRCVPASDAYIILQWVLKSGSFGCAWLHKAPIADVAKTKPNVPIAPDPAKKQPPVSAEKLVPWPIETGRDLAGRTFQIDGGAMTLLRLKADSFVYDMEWSRDGKFVYLLERSGILRKIAVPSFREERILSIGAETTSMGLSKEGLAVAVGQKAIWVLDEESLELKTKIPLDTVYRFSTSPSQNCAFTNHSGTLDCINLASGRVVSSLSMRDLRAPVKIHPLSGIDTGFSVPYLTPDGQFMFLRGGGSLYRFPLSAYPRIDEIGPPIGPGHITVDDRTEGALQFSADSSRVCWARDNQPVFNPSARPPELGGFAFLLIFKTGDLQAPELTLNVPGGVARAVAFDTTADRVRLLSSVGDLVTFTPQGIVEHTVNLFKPINSRREDYETAGLNLSSNRISASARILLHPGGGKALIFARDMFVWIEFAGP